MAKTKKPKTRNILIRNIDKRQAELLDAFKESKGIKTDSKAVIFMIESITRQETEIMELKNEIDNFMEETQKQKQILNNLQTGFYELNNYFEKEE